MITKLCRQCKTEWPMSDEFFYRNRHTVSGLGSPCKACIARIRAHKEDLDARIAKPWPPYERWAAFTII